MTPARLYFPNISSPAQFELQSGYQVLPPRRRWDLCPSNLHPLRRKDWDFSVVGEARRHRAQEFFFGSLARFEMVVGCRRSTLSEIEESWSHFHQCLGQSLIAHCIFDVCVPARHLSREQCGCLSSSLFLSMFLLLHLTRHGRLVKGLMTQLETLFQNNTTWWLRGTFRSSGRFCILIFRPGQVQVQSEKVFYPFKISNRYRGFGGKGQLVRTSAMLNKYASVFHGSASAEKVYSMTKRTQLSSQNTTHSTKQWCKFRHCSVFFLELFHDDNLIKLLIFHIDSCQGLIPCLQGAVEGCPYASCRIVFFRRISARGTRVGSPPK